MLPDGKLLNIDIPAAGSGSLPFFVSLYTDPMSLIARFLGTVFALLAAAYLVPGFIIDSLYAAAIVALALGVINITLKPLVLLIALPLQLLTLGFFTFVVNAAFLLFIASFIDGFSIAGNFFEQFITALLAGLVIAAVLWLLDLFF